MVAVYWAVGGGWRTFLECCPLADGGGFYAKTVSSVPCGIIWIWNFLEEEAVPLVSLW